MWFVVLFVAACGSSATPDEDKVITIGTSAGPIDIHVGTPPPDAEFMCSDPADYKTYPRSKIHVVPTYSAESQQYVGSFRCDTHWKQAIAQTRARFASHPSDDEGAALLSAVVAHGVTKDQLRAIVSGKPIAAAIDATLDAIESGKLVLEP